MSDHIYRVRPGMAAAVLHPESGTHVVPDPTRAYAAEDPLVTEYPWMFATDEQIAVERRTVPETVDSVPIETSTARPGQRSNARRTAASGDQA